MYIIVDLIITAGCHIALIDRNDFAGILNYTELGFLVAQTPTPCILAQRCENQFLFSKHISGRI